MLVEVDATIAGIIVDCTVQALQIPTVHFMSFALCHVTCMLSVCSTSHFSLTLDNLGAPHLPLLPFCQVAIIIQNLFVVKL